jgi:hypothetical protein
MAQIQLDDQVFKAAQRRAADGGYSSVDEYITDVVVHDLSEETDNFDSLFTPDRIAELDRVSAEIKAGGKTYSLAEATEHFENKRIAWLANHAS